MAHHQREAADQSEFRIVLVGKTGAGKSASGNTIFGRREFNSTLASSSVTAECKKNTGYVDGQTVAVVDTPGLFDTNREMNEVKREVAKAVCLAAPGPHVFLIVIHLGRFSQEEQDTVKVLQEMFGEEARKYSMVLFTHGDDLEADGVTIETVIGSNQHLCDFIRQCSGGYHVFNNRDKNNHDQITELLKNINRLVKRNGGRCYSTEMFQEAERAIREEQERLQRENPDMDPEESRRRAESNNSFIQAVLIALANFSKDVLRAAVGAAVEAVSVAVRERCVIQ